jgi:hypothetical protein
MNLRRFWDACAAAATGFLAASAINVSWVESLRNASERQQTLRRNNNLTRSGAAKAHYPVQTRA